MNRMKNSRESQEMQKEEKFVIAGMALIAAVTMLILGWHFITGIL
jgi:hypothetical protein